MSKVAGTGYNPFADYVFLKDVKQEFAIKKGDKLKGEESAGYVVFAKFPKCPPNARCGRLFVKIPFSEIGKTIKKVDSIKAPTSTNTPVKESTTTSGGTTDMGTSVSNEVKPSLLSTKNIVVGGAILVIGYFVYTKFIKKGK